MKKRVQIQSKPPQEDCSEQLAAAQAEIAELNRELEVYRATEDAYAGGAFETINRLKDALRQALRERDAEKSNLKWLQDKVIEAIQKCDVDAAQLVEKFAQERSAARAELSSTDFTNFVETVAARFEQHKKEEAKEEITPAQFDIYALVRALMGRSELVGTREAYVNLIRNFRFAMDGKHGACLQIMWEWQRVNTITFESVKQLDMEWVGKHIGVKTHKTLHNALLIIADFEQDKAKTITM